MAHYAAREAPRALQPAVAPGADGAPWSAGWERSVRVVAVGGACVAAALCATWPLAANMSTAILLGTEHAPTVGLFSIWTLWWTADRAAHGFARYWDAPFFYPNQGVFTYSEPEPLTGLVVAPLWGLGAPPALIHNLALLLILTLNGIFAYRLARALDVATLPAALGALLTVTLPYVAKQYAVLNLLPLFGMLWTLDGLVRFGRHGAVRHALWAAAGLLVAYLTCQQYALLFGGFVVAAALLALTQQGWTTRAMLRLLGAAVPAGVLILVVAWPTLSLHGALGLSRDEPVVQGLSAHLSDFLTRPSTAWLGLPARSMEDRAGLFPGAVLLALALYGLVAGWRRGRARPWTVYLGACAIMATILALGLNLNLAGWQPFATLRLMVPGFDQLRSPYRFAAVMQLTLPILAAVALAHIRERLPTYGAGLILAATLVGAVENLCVPGALTPVPLSARTAWTAWLRGQPDGTVVAHIPFPGGLHVADYAVEGWRLFHQIDHHKPLVNGYSGNFPPGYTPFQLEMARTFPGHGLLCTLALSLGANLLVVDAAWLDRHEADLVPRAAFLDPVYSDDEVQIYRLHAPAGACTPAGGSP